MAVEEALPFLIPLVVLQVALIGIALFDLTRPERRVRGGSKLVWGLVIVLFQLLGPLAYFLFGREEE
jgi:Phospholipase_D-nuclease N-terminal